MDDLASALALWVAGDELAALAVADICEESSMNLHPFEVGKAYFIEQQTLYYVGRVVEVGINWIRLEDASWVHWTGRKSVLFEKQSFDPKHFSGRKPRTEYEGDKLIFTTSTSAANPWHGELPRSSIQA